MKRFKTLITGILVLSLIVTTILSSCTVAETAKLKVVTSTSLIAQIVERVGGDMVDVINIIPPAQCPGHFDVKPGDIQKLAEADLFLLHGWQGEMFSQELIDSANNPDLSVINVNVKVGDNTTFGQALDRLELATIHLHRQHQAASHRLAVERHVARAAYTMLAADMSTGLALYVADEISEVHSRRHAGGDRFAVQGECDVVQFFKRGHEAIHVNP